MSQPDRPFFLILDVGHGNCAILFDTEGVSIIDAPEGPTPLAALTEHEVDVIASTLVSHADSDHIEGLIPVLLNYEVNRVYVNPDGSKADSRVWEKFLCAVEDAQRRRIPPRRLTEKRYRADASPPTILPLSTDQSNSDGLGCGAVGVEVLWPRYSDVLRGQGHKTREGKTQTTNSLSAVLRYSYEGTSRVLLASDIDKVGLEQLLLAHPENKADVLVFPHHGGHSGSQDEVQFARELCNAVEPKYVLFSIGRNQYSNPLKDIMEGVKSSRSQPRIACTQLSPHCHSKDRPVPESKIHSNGLPAKGRASASCCAGSFKILLNGDTQITEPCAQSHQAFVRSLDSPLCLHKFGGGAEAS
jgi:competence protein ComEC